MAVERSTLVDRAFVEALEALEALEAREAAPGPPSVERRDLDGPVRPGTRLTARAAMALYESQVLARHLDLAARRMKAEGTGFYTIASAGHEGNVVLGRLLEPTDPCFLHYRSAALMVERARHRCGGTPVFDTLLSLAASREDPTSGGRHKVFGSRALWVPPQTSTIASHLPKAVGWALGHERARRLGLPPVTDARAIACVSFGDASVNHAVALTAFNTAAWAVRHGLPVPVLFVCEDNGLGISVRTPRGWVHDRLGGVDWLDYRVADGLDLAAAHDAAAGAVEACRRTRRPVFLHLEVVRLLGHAGSDVEQGYRAEAEILADEARDPVRATARLLVAEGWLSAPEALEVYEEARARVDRASREAGRRPRLATAEEVMAPLAPRGPGRPDRVRAEAERTDYHAARVAAFGGEALLPERHGRGRHLAMLLNWGLADLMARYPEACVFGEDVAAKGGVYHVTTGLRERFGAARVFDTLLDETSILGLAVGFAQAGLLPIPEIQYLAYVHNAEDQLRGEACSLGFFSAGQFANPMVVRIASFAYQKGFGGHFHNDNSVAALRDVPGLVLAVPSRGDDAVGMLRTLAALARVEGRVGVLLEPIALYMTKDLHEKGDGRWECEFPPPGVAVPLGEPRVWYADESDDLLIVTHGNGVPMALRASLRLHREGLRPRVLDLRWLAPLPHGEVARHAAECGRVLVVDECRRSGGVGEALVAELALRGLAGPTGAGPRVDLVTAWDTYIPLGDAANLVLPSEEDIVRAARRLAGVEANR